ncbi:mercury(II) reductase [Brevibacterium antiquum]
MSGMSSQDVDLAILGSGSGAFAAAIRATTLGKTVLMVERGTVGGTCVNTGCVPSKALLAAAEARHTAADADRFPGISATTGPVDMPELIEGKQTLVEGMRTEKYLDLMTDYGWQLRQGQASFTGSQQDPALQITTDDGAVETVHSSHYLVATGSTPTIPEIEGLDGVDYLTSATAMELDEVPASMLVVGGGYVGLEQAQLFARLGTQVTMLVRSRLASTEEPEAHEVLAEVFAHEGIEVVPRALITKVTTDSSNDEVMVTATVDGDEQTFTAQQLLVATGRHAVTGGLNLDTVGVATGVRGEVLIDETLATSNHRIWAAGDVTGHPQFVYAASAHGGLAAENMFTNTKRSLDYTTLPRVTFTSPNLAAVGMTDAQAQAAGYRCQCRVLPLEYVPRAMVNRDIRGFIKIVADADNDRILGITAVAKEAADLAATGVYIIQAAMTLDQVANLWSPYLTMAEGIKIAAQSFTTDVSKLSCCAA